MWTKLLLLLFFMFLKYWISRRGRLLLLLFEKQRDIESTTAGWLCQLERRPCRWLFLVSQSIGRYATLYGVYIIISVWLVEVSFSRGCLLCDLTKYNWSNKVSKQASTVVVVTVVDSVRLRLNDVVVYCQKKKSRRNIKNTFEKENKKRIIIKQL